MATLEFRAKEPLTSWQYSTYNKCNVINNELQQMTREARQCPILKISHTHFSSTWGVGKQFGRQASRTKTKLWGLSQPLNRSDTQRHTNMVNKQVLHVHLIVRHLNFIKDMKLFPYLGDSFLLKEVRAPCSLLLDTSCILVLGIIGLNEASCPFSVLPTAVKQLQLDLRWHVKNQYLIWYKESVNRSSRIVVTFLMLLSTVHFDWFVPLSVW
jgi:hypothetical protein